MARTNATRSTGPEARIAEPGSRGPEVERSLTVPVGEFDQGETMETTLEQNKLRASYAQATIKRDAAGALLGMAEPAPPAVELLHPDASGSATSQFERADPTQGDDRGDATTAAPPPQERSPTGGTLRTTASLPRRRGVGGDLRYLGTVVFGTRAARRELAEIEARQVTRHQSRRHHLITLGRAAAQRDEVTHPAVVADRTRLAAIEAERAQHADHVTAAEAELVRLRQDREAAAKQHVADLASADQELADLARQLAPLEKEAAAARRRAANLRDSLRELDARIGRTEASLSAVKTEESDRAGILAEIATLKADRKAIQGDEPVIAAAFDALLPRIAAHEATRNDVRRRRTELAAAEDEDKLRVDETLVAIGARRKVVDRASAAAEARRDKLLFQLGERLAVDRPPGLAGELAPIEEIDVELGSADRRVMELREILSSVDRWKVARGVVWLTLLVGVLGAITVGVLYVTQVITT